MEKKVTVLTPNGRRQVFKVTPNTTLLEILEDACRKHQFDSENYGLSHHNKDVGLTQMFRFSGLPNNCVLEMKELEKKRVAVEVDICVLLEDGTRAQGQFKPVDSVWHVIETLKSDVATFKSPVAIYMRKDIIGRENLSATTLKSLGITAGRAMIRVTDKNPEELKVQANVYVAPKVKEISSEETDEIRPRKTQKTDGPRGFVITKELIQTLKQETSEKEGEQAIDKQQPSLTEVPTEPVKVNIKFDWGSSTGHSMSGAKTVLSENAENMEAENEPEPDFHIIGERKALIYSMDSSQQQVEDLPDSFFDLTVHDLKLVLRDLQKIAKGGSEAPLLTEKLRELEQNKMALNKLGRYKNCVIRIQFPDRHVLQGFFKPIDTITNLMDFVRLYLEEPNTGFHLFTIPPKKVLPLTETLLELNFVPTALVHFAFDDEEMKPVNFLRAEFLQKLTSIEGAIHAANKYRQLTHHALDASAQQEQVELQNDTPSTSKGAIPKQRIS